MEGTRRTPTVALRLRSVWIGGAVAAVALTMLMAPASAASSPNFVYKAPFHKALITPTNDLWEATGCAKATHKLATLHASTGAGGWSGSASAGSCKGPVSKAIDSYAISQGAVQVTLPVKVPGGSATTTTFNVTWDVTAKGNYSLSYTGSCPLAVYNATLGYGYSQCEAIAISQVIGFTELVDLTTGVITYPTVAASGAFAYDIVENYSYCYNATNCVWIYNLGYSTGSSSYSGLNVENFSVTAVTNHADKYALETYIGGDLVVEFATYDGHGSAYMNLATGGNGYKLVSVTES